VKNAEEKGKRGERPKCMDMNKCLRKDERWKRCLKRTRAETKAEPQSQRERVTVV